MPCDQVVTNWHDESWDTFISFNWKRRVISSYIVLVAAYLEQPSSTRIANVRVVRHYVCMLHQWRQVLLMWLHEMFRVQKFRVGKCSCLLALSLNYEVLFWRIEATHSILDLHSVVVDGLQDSVIWEIKSVGNQWQRPQIHPILWYSSTAWLPTSEACRVTSIVPLAFALT